MKKKIYFNFLAVLLPIALLLLTGCAAPRSVLDQPGVEGGLEPVVRRSVVADYDQVWDDLTMTLNSRGLVISSVSHVGEMLARTGKALGRTKAIFARANVMEFCSAVISRDMMEDNPHYIAFCPYQIMVYSLPDEPGRVYLAYRRLIWGNGKNRQRLERVEKLLTSLIAETIVMQEEYQ